MPTDLLNQILTEPTSMTDSISSLLLSDRFDEAIDTCLQTLEVDPENKLVQLQLGLAFLLSGQEEEAQEIWLSMMLQGDLDEPNNFNESLLKNFLANEAAQRIHAKNLEQAEIIVYYLLEVDDKNEYGYKMLGDISLKRGDVDNTIHFYEDALKINPDCVDAILNLGLVFKTVCEPKRAKDLFLKLVSQKVYLHESFSSLQEIYQQQGEILEACLYEGLTLVVNHQYEEAIEVLKPLLGKNFQTERIYWILFECYKKSGRNLELSEFVERATQILPQNLVREIKSQLALPIQYNHKHEIDFYRERFTQGLRKMISEVALTSEEGQNQALDILEGHTNFFLAYQECDDLALQVEYGAFIHQVMKQYAPHWTQPLAIRKLEGSRRIRVGYISTHFFEHTVCKLFQAWLNLDSEKFEVFVYHIGENFDGYTQKIKESSEHFYHVVSGFQVMPVIYDDQIDILVYPEIGMEPAIMQIAALRLAPIQCMAWGHPVTSGLPTIDYFLSSELMEPESVQSYYSEKLIKLPNLGITYTEPSLPEQRLTREDFGIPNNAVVYLCCQSIFKYLPQYDYVFAAIAQQVPDAKFVFISTRSQSLSERFNERLNRAFSSYNLNFRDYCLAVPSQDPVGYFSLNLVADIFLDTLGWSGGNTTLEAVACHLPIVTYPGKFMRGRHSFAILRRLGITETIATSIENYIQIAIQLGVNSNFRTSITRKVSQAKHRIFNDSDCMQALEKFYETVLTSEARL
jgi:protein O-GlcNAc transferase